MKKLLFFLFMSSLGFSQSIYKGNVSENGVPIPGVNICVFNTDRCTVSDFDGNYAIEVKPGDQLQLSLVGMKTKIIRITDKTGLDSNNHVYLIENQDYADKLKKPADSVKASKQTGYFDFNLTNGISEYDLIKISRNNTGLYQLKRRHEYSKMAFEVSQEYVYSSPIRLPKYQQTFAQGKSLNGALTYQSPETNEIFSWGPSGNALQYSQNSSPYYPQGDIINRISANAAALTAYNPNNFYRNTEDHKVLFNTLIESPKGNYFKFNFAYKRGNIVIPTTRNNELTASLKYFRNVSQHSKIETTLSFNDFENNFSNANFGVNKVLFANAVTPFHFDTKLSSILENGLPRNYSVLENNPYYLIHNNLDTNKSKTASFNFNHNYNKDKIVNIINADFQSSEIQNTNGQYFYFAETSPNYNKRIERFQNVSVSDFLRYTFNSRALIESKLDFRYQNRDLQRNYYSGFNVPSDFPNNGAVQSKLDISQDRFEVFSTLMGSYTFRDIFSYYDEIGLKASSNLNYSSTAKNDILPGYSVSAELRRFFDTGINLTIGHSYNETEPSLQNNNLNFNSLRYQLGQFKQLANNLELITPQNAIATHESVTRIDLNYQLRYFWYLSLNYYDKRVSNLYTPVFNGNIVNWSPDVNYKQHGVEFSVEKYTYYRRNFSYGFNLNFTYYKNEVRSLNNNQDRIPFAGFADINKNYIVGQPLGVIVGSHYLRNADQKIIIGEDGFPVKDPDPKILGNPNPDFVVGLYNSFSYRDFSLQLAFDWSQGGKLWNGTQQTLNYYGRSELTGNQRNTTNYIFNGVNESGNVNTKQVSFYDVDLPVDQNRWVRYGVGGVAEDAIEDATYIRLSTVNLSYLKDLQIFGDKFNFKISVFVNNVFVAAKSKTAFSNNALFNSIDTGGLDYFNSPLMRSFGSSLTIKF